MGGGDVVGWLGSRRGSGGERAPLSAWLHLAGKPKPLIAVVVTIIHPRALWGGDTVSRTPACLCLASVLWSRSFAGELQVGVDWAG